MLRISKNLFVMHFTESKSEHPDSETDGKKSDEENVVNGDTTEVDLDADFVEPPRPCCSMAPRAFGNQLIISRACTVCALVLVMRKDVFTSSQSKKSYPINANVSFSHAYVPVHWGKTHMCLMNIYTHILCTAICTSVLLISSIIVAVFDIR